MKKSIKKQIIARILNDPYKATREHLCHLGSVIHEKADYEKLSRVELKKEFSQSIYYFIGGNFEFVDFDNLTKIVKSIEKILVNRINIISQKKDKKLFYELEILLYALDCLSVCKTLEISKLVKNDRVQLCYDLVRLIDDCHGGEEEIEKWLNERLKKLKFN